MSIADQMKAWPSAEWRGDYCLRLGALEARLRTTADALRDALDDFVRVPYGASHEDVAYIRDFEQRARAVLAQLEKEGLT